MQKESINISNYPILLTTDQQQLYHSILQSHFHQLLITNPFSFYAYDPRFQKDPKPTHSYIGLIAMAILSSPDQQLVLADIYRWILEHYPYFRTRGTGWRNSVRHNLSLNDCFVKTHRSINGKGHYWTIHPANLADFSSGDFRRHRAQRRVRKCMGLSIPDDEADEDDDEDILPINDSTNEDLHPSTHPTIITQNILHDYFHNVEHIAIAPPRKRCFDVDSLLEPEQPCSIKRQKQMYSTNTHVIT